MPESSGKIVAKTKIGVKQMKKMEMRCMAKKRLKT
jgi:hypothetical protein